MYLVLKIPRNAGLSQIHHICIIVLCVFSSSNVIQWGVSSQQHVFSRTIDYLMMPRLSELVWTRFENELLVYLLKHTTQLRLFIHHVINQSLTNRKLILLFDPLKRTTKFTLENLILRHDKENKLSKATINTNNIVFIKYKLQTNCTVIKVTSLYYEYLKISKTPICNTNNATNESALKNKKRSMY